MKLTEFGQLRDVGGSELIVKRSARLWVGLRAISRMTRCLFEKNLNS